jgi:hypothetical protein
LAPQRGRLELSTARSDALAQPGHRQIGLGLDPAAHRRFKRRHPRAAVAAHPQAAALAAVAVAPSHRVNADPADLEALGDIGGPFAARYRAPHPIA